MRELKLGEELVYSYVSKVAYEGERRELKHLSTCRKRKIVSKMKKNKETNKKYDE